MKRILLVQLSLLFSYGLFSQGVGIGTANPVEKLQVVGNIKADTLKPNALKITLNAGEGKLLTSDATGNARWQELLSTSNTAGTVGFGSWGDCSTNNISEYNPVIDTLPAKNDVFGNSIAQSGNFAIIGANKGYADIFRFNGSNWVFMQKLVQPGNTTGTAFGFAVAISDSIAIVGAPFDSVGSVVQGTAFIYKFNGITWSLLQKISDPGGAANDFFGGFVSVSGNNIIVGSSSDDVGTNVDQGSASTFHFTGTSWVFVQKLTDVAGTGNDQFGITSLSGNFAVIGAPFAKIGANAGQGFANIYQFNGASWIFMKRLFDSTAAPTNGFGIKVSISGNFAMVGAPGNIVNAKGSVLLFRFDGSNWNFFQKISDPITPGSNFGNSVAISGDYALAGTPNVSSGGYAVLYSLLGLEWSPYQTITDPHGRATNSFGNAVSIDGINKRFMIAAPAYGLNSGKVVFGKVN
ncbi:MAG: hypothetical protein ABJA78_15715 [Ferruginibacter sp.]